MFVGGGTARAGLVVGTVYDWEPGEGSVVSWEASPTSIENARQAPISDVPVSYMQENHLRGFTEFAARGAEYARLVMGSWDVPGRCDIRTMDYVINTHIRRHETYHSWFEYRDPKNIIRRTIKNPRDIKFVPTKHGEMTTAEWHDYVLSTPDPVEWNCFRFGVIQRADHFSFFTILDHLHTDPAMVSGIYTEIVMMYRAIASGAPPLQLPPTASHDDFCRREREYTSALTLDSPQVRAWIEFAENNGQTISDFPLPLGDPSVAYGTAVITEQLLSLEQTDQFESLCLASGARFSGGLFACVALAQYELTGAEMYYGITPTDKRKTPAEYMTMGWFSGAIPFTVPVDPTSFAETAHAAQASFDANIELANVPYHHVLELAPWLGGKGPNYYMINYMDAGLPPLSAVAASHLDEANACAYCDPRSPAYLYMTVIRLFDEVTMMVFFQDNPIARESVTTWMDALKSVLARVTEGRDPTSSLRDVASA